MSTPNQTFPLENKRISDGIVDFARHAQDYMYSHFSLRERLEEMDRAYQREEDTSIEDIQARNAQRRGDKTKRRNITVPIVMPQVESALTYFTEVYLSSYPIFGVGADPEFDDAALQMETIIGEQSITAKWAPHLMQFFRDNLKYNLAGIEVVWDQKTTAALETDANYMEGKQGKPKEKIWEGNCLRRMDMYNTIFDPRVHPSLIASEGEFAGYKDIMSRVRLKKFINNLYDEVPRSVAMRAFESGTGTITAAGVKDHGFYIPIINPEALIDRENLGSFDWMAWVSNNDRQKIQYRNIYEVLTLYARIIPNDFGLYVPQDNTPQVWKFIIINDRVLLYAERLTNAHDNIPIYFGQVNDDGLDFQTKSFAQNVRDYQDLASAAMNANIASKRKLILDRMFYDPSRIRQADINNDNPTSKIPVRPSAYNKPVGDAFATVPYRDELSQNLVNEAELYFKYANITNGQNPAQQGQFQKGNKTRHEYADIMGHSNGRNKTMALGTEHSVMTDIKDTIRLNILQYQPADELYNRDTGSYVKIDPMTLRKASNIFKVSDGMLPGDKILNTEEFQVAAQALASNPVLSQRYRIEQVFTHLFKQRGVDLRPFEKTQIEIQYEQQLAAWQQAVQAALARKDLTPEQIKQILPPQPQPPAPELIAQQMKQQAQSRGASLAKMLQAIQANQAPTPSQGQPQG